MAIPIQSVEEKSDQNMTSKLTLARQILVKSLIARFDILNQQHFGGEIERPHIMLSILGEAWACTYISKGECWMVISTRAPTARIDEILLHEMCHLASCQDHDGAKFKWWLAKCGLDESEHLPEEG